MMKRCFCPTWLTVIACQIALLNCVSAGAEAASPEPLSAEKTREKLKGAKIIIIQDYDKINPLDQMGWPEVNAPIKDYDRKYPSLLKEYLGIELVKVTSGELISEIGKVDEEKARELAEKWIADAKEVKYDNKVSKELIVTNAKLYFSLKEFLSKYDGDAITMTSWYFSGTHNPHGPILKLKLPLSILELSKEHIPCSCQCHIDCLATMLVGTSLTGGRMGFDGDVLNDWIFKPTGERPKNVIVVAHCGAPINPYGNDRSPYIIRDHVAAAGIGTTMDWPVNKPVTVVKFDVYRKKVSVFTGTALDGPSLYEDFDNVICRNKVVVQLDDPENSYLLPSDPKEGAFRDWFGSWGCHQVLFYGNIKDKIKEFAELVGFEIVE